MKKGNCERSAQKKTAKVLGLFMAAVLAAGSGGCTSPIASGHKHVDSNKDGYCDEDGEPVGSSSGGYYGGSRFFRRSYPTATGGGDVTSSPSGISTGTSVPKGGIGSHSMGSAGG